jgi:hypothetical protein
MTSRNRLQDSALGPVDSDTQHYLALVLHLPCLPACSGTILDHKQVIITGPKPGGPAPPPVDVQVSLSDS